MLTVTTGSAPFNGSYRPEQTLATFNNINAQGTWTLTIRDAAALDTGKVTAATLSILGTPFQRLALGIHDIEAATTTVAKTANAGKVVPVPLAVWIGPDRDAEPIRSADRRGAFVETRFESTMRTSDLSSSVTRPEFARFVANLSLPTPQPKQLFELPGEE